MRYATVCSGIEAPSVAWHALGWRPVFFSEIEAFPSAVLAHRWPGVPNLGDMTRFKEWPDATLDVLCGGTPCQSFSVAGLRKGLADPRGNLMLTYLAIADRYRPRWLVWENVPGVLSSGGGRDFGTFLGGLGQLGYGFAYRVLDAQFFGVPQRRRRVFVVGCLGDWRAAAAVLFERHSLSGHPAPRRETGQGLAAATARSVAIRGRDGTPHDKANAILTPNGGRGGIGVGAVLAPEVARCIATREGTSQDWETTTMVAHSLRAGGFDASEDGTGRGTPLVPVAFPANLSGTQCASAEDLAPSMGAKNPTAIAFDTTQITSKTNRCNPQPGGPCHPLAAGAHPPAIAGMQVRRLTPRECERLQGFEDDYTLVTYRKKPAADGPRYKALGNSMAVPVVRWIGERITAVDSIIKDHA